MYDTVEHVMQRCYLRARNDLWQVVGPSIHTHRLNEVMLVWGSLRLTPITAFGLIALMLVLVHGWTCVHDTDL